MNIGIVGPISTDCVSDFLETDSASLPPGYGGAPLMGVLIGELLKQGHKISAFTTDSSLFLSGQTVKASGPNFDFYICPSRPRAWRLNKNWLGRAVDGFAFERLQIFNAIKKAAPDIVHAHWTYEFALAAIKTGIPHLITCHDAPAVVLQYTRSPYRAIRYLMARQVFRKGKHFSAVSEYMAKSVEHYTKNPISLVPNPLADYVLALGRVRTLPTTRRIGMICNGWDARKNPEPALLAFSKIRSELPSAELHLFGAGFGVGEFAESWCKERNLDVGIKFHGITPHKQLIGQLNSLDLLIHPALEESFGVAVAEAMALGLPVVAGRYSGAVPWVVGSDSPSEALCCAVLTDVSNAESIASAVITAFDQYYPQRSAAGCARAHQMYAPSVIAESYSTLYRKVLFSKP